MSMEYASASLIAGSSIARVRWARSLTVAARSSNPGSSRCLDEGRWQGRQLVSAELVKEATIDQLTKEQRSDGFQQPLGRRPVLLLLVGRRHRVPPLFRRCRPIWPEYSRRTRLPTHPRHGLRRARISGAHRGVLCHRWTMSSLSRSSGPKWRGYLLVTIRRRRTPMADARQQRGERGPVDNAAR